MIIYNVTLKADHSIADQWVKWMKEEHMPEMLQHGLFVDYKLCRLLEQDESDGVTFIAQYFCDSLDDYHTYVSTHAPDMRKKGMEKFGDKVLAFRTVMEVI